MSESVSLGNNNSIETKKLPAIEVDNEVSWVNQGVDTPFNLKLGESSKLGLFLIKNPKQATFHVVAKDNHFRSALLGQVFIKDREHNILYRDIDLKGMGPIGPDLNVDDLTPGLAKNRMAVWGFYDNQVALSDADHADYFTNKGLRTYQILAVIDLKEIVDSEGNKISIQEARDKKYIPEDFKPAVQIRAFGTKARITDAISESKNGRHDLIDDARIMVAEELGISVENFSINEYAGWFATTLGKQLSIINNDEYEHGGLHSHNITLDCRIVDLDNMLSLPDNTKERVRIIIRDYSYALRSLRQLSKAIKFSDLNVLEIRFKKSYKENLDPEIIALIDKAKIAASQQPGGIAYLGEFRDF